MTILPTQTTPRISASDIVITQMTLTPSEPKPKPNKTPREKAADNRFFALLRSLKAQCGTDRNDQAFAAIALCIEYGIDTRKRIRATLEHIGFDIQHATIILNKKTGVDPAKFPWRRDSEGRYHLNS